MPNIKIACLHIDPSHDGNACQACRGEYEMEKEQIHQAAIESSNDQFRMMHKSDTTLILSLQNQIVDLRKNAREYARKDVIAELRDWVERLIEKERFSGAPHLGEKIIELLDSYTDQK